MQWLSFFDRIVLLNLPHREDRLLESAELLEKYQIPFERVEAIYDKESGARGLRDTMRGLFEDCIEKNIKSVLVFEDDVSFCEETESFHHTMNNVVANLPEYYIMCFLGCQVTRGFSHYHSPNILAGQGMFSTHAVFYSLQGMKEILARDFNYPIDNFFVEFVEPLGGSYCTYPLLCSQRAGYSDIGHEDFSWEPFIVPRYYQKLNEMKNR